MRDLVLTLYWERFVVFELTLWYILKTTFTLEDGKMIQKQVLDGQLSSELTREIVDGKLKVVRVIASTWALVF